MKVLITRSTAVGGVHLEAGETHDLSDKDALTLMNMGKATEAVEECSMPEASLPPAPPTASKTKKVKASVDSD